jgi:hypothetical protein
VVPKFEASELCRPAHQGPAHERVLPNGAADCPVGGTSCGLGRQGDAEAEWHAFRVPTLDADGWQLESGVERQAEAAESFEIPDESIRSRLVPGCEAKLIFTLRGHDGPQVERMWVRITGFTDPGYAGVLNNVPRTQDAPIGLRDRVEFGPSHIIDALPPEDWTLETSEYEE